MDRRKIKRRDIRLLYRYRWQIEIFFKELKHVLNIKKFFCYHPNGIKSQIYLALSVYVLGKILVAQSAQVHGVKVADISFARAITATRIWCTFNSGRLFCTRVQQKAINNLLEQIYIFAYIKRKHPYHSKEATNSLTTNTEKVSA